VPSIVDLSACIARQPTDEIAATATDFTRTLPPARQSDGTDRAIVSTFIKNYEAARDGASRRTLSRILLG
jgi:hypothetical protein